MQPRGGALPTQAFQLRPHGKCYLQQVTAFGEAVMACRFLTIRAGVKSVTSCAPEADGFRVADRRDGIAAFALPPEWSILFACP